LVTLQVQKSELDFGILLPTREMVLSGVHDPTAVYRLADRAEELGFHSLWAGDSLTARPRVEALTTLAAVGSRTRCVRLGTSIFLAALRHPILLAHQLASLDWLTGGRIDLGIGYGRRNDPAHEREYEMLGLPATNRIKRSEECVEVMRRLWRENDVSHLGVFARFEHVTLEPKPVQSGGVPIWLASNNVDPGLRRVARMGDGWLNNIISPDVYRECWDKICAYAVEAGRDPKTIQPGLYVTVAAGGGEAAAEGKRFIARYYDRPYEAVANAMLCIIGSWNEVLDRIEAYRAAGARTLVIRFATSDQSGHLEACAECLHHHGLL
jgi:alkanesulfonate monooxygenase SsuD/methylene tetrahydromethanopterin reductase-like flavin-dependent oxidoreductase (luciferase family)